MSAVNTVALLQPQEVQQAQAWLAAGPWTDGARTAGPQAAAVKRNQQLATDAPHADALRALVLQALQRSPAVLSYALPRRVFAPQFNRYTPQAPAYGAHVDQAVRLLADGTALRTDLSVTVFFSDPADYEGGELQIEGHSTGIKLPAGHAVLYDATAVHEVRPVTRGQRLASFLWIESLVPQNTQRALLWQLDSALTALRQAHGDNAHTVALAGVYHNLLRQWSHT